MNHEEIVTRLCLIYPSEVIYEITMETVISAIIRRLGEKALDLSVEDIELSRICKQEQMTIDNARPWVYFDVYREV